MTGESRSVKEKAATKQSSGFVTRVVSGVIYAVLFIGCIYFGSIRIAVFVAAMSGLCCYEFYRMMRKDGKVPNELLGLAAAVAFPIADRKSVV